MILVYTIYLTKYYTGEKARG